MSSLSLLLLLAAIIWFWLDSARARELATEICRAACEQHQVQFLDQAVALTRLGLSWRSQGLRLRRVFRFEYSEQGVGRHQGYVVMNGIQLEEMSMGLPDDPADR